MLSGREVAAHSRFQEELPRLTRTATYAFRALRTQQREEAIAETLASVWSAWHGLIKRGREPAQVGISGITRNAIRHVRRHHPLNNHHSGTAALDVRRWRAQEELGARVVSLNARQCPTKAEWEESLLAARYSDPADAAAFRVDFAEWLGNLPPRRRRVAELLSLGHETGAVARLVGVTPSAISQTRTWLQTSWNAFQGQTPEFRAAAHGRRASK